MAILPGDVSPRRSGMMIAESSRQFLLRGGSYELALMQKYDSGELVPPGDYQYQEYPKMLRLNERAVEVPRMVEFCDGTKKPVVETKKVWDEIIVNSEDEEERVLSGGQTSAQLEEARQDLLLKCRNLGVRADPSWSAVRLRRELGEKMDAPEPVDEMAAMREKLARLEEMAAMKAKIAALEAQLVTPQQDDADELRTELEALGVEVDRRWSVKTLRQKLDEATAPGVAA